MRFPRRKTSEIVAPAIERPTPITDEGREVGAPDGTQLAILLAAATAAVDEEFKRAERLDSKARGQLTIVGAFFAFVQTMTATALSDLRDAAATPTSQTTLVAVAVLAALCLFIALVKSSFAWRLRKEQALNPEDIRDWVRYAKVGNPQVAIKLTEQAADIYANRRTANDSRANHLRQATIWVLTTAAVVTIELVLALVLPAL